jgi:hypothetical protein
MATDQQGDSRVLPTLRSLGLLLLVVLPIGCGGQLPTAPSAIAPALSLGLDGACATDADAPLLTTADQSTVGILDRCGDAGDAPQTD